MRRLKDKSDRWLRTGEGREQRHRTRTLRAIQVTRVRKNKLEIRKSVKRKPLPDTSLSMRLATSSSSSLGFIYSKALCQFVFQPCKVVPFDAALFFSFHCSFHSHLWHRFAGRLFELEHRLLFFRKALAIVGEVGENGRDAVLDGRFLSPRKLDKLLQQPLAHRIVNGTKYNSKDNSQCGKDTGGVAQEEETLTWRHI